MDNKIYSGPEDKGNPWLSQTQLFQANDLKGGFQPLPRVAPEVEYDRLNFLLNETTAPVWQEALAPDLKDGLLLPYRIARHAAGLRLGWLPRLNPHLRQIKRAALGLLLVDLQAHEAKNFASATWQPLLDFLKTEMALVQNDFSIFPEFSVFPSFENLDSRMKLEVLQAAIALLETAESQSLVEADPSFQKLKEGYTSRIEKLSTPVVTLPEKQPQPKFQSQTYPQPQTPFNNHETSVPVNWPVSGETTTGKTVPAQTQDTVVKPVAAKMVSGSSISISPTKSPTPLKEKFKWEDVWGALLSETTLRTLLYLGALLVVAAAAIFITINWNQFSPPLQVTMLLGVDLSFYGGGVFILKKLKLARAGLTFIAIGSAILPFCLYGYTRPEILGLGAQTAWLGVSLVALACYLPVALWLREKIFGYMLALAALNAFCTILYQFQISPEWIAAACVPFAAALVWADFRLQANPELSELAEPAFWVGQLTVLVAISGLFSYTLYASYTGISYPSLEWATGASWLLAMLFYGFCSNIFPAQRHIYRYGTSLSGLIFACLLLHKLSPASAFYGLVLGVLGLVYLLVETLPELVEQLNENPDGVNNQPWDFKKVLNLQRPLTVSGWTMILASPLLASNPFTLAAYLGLLAVFFLGATLLYNWRFLAYPALLFGMLGYYSFVYEATSWSGLVWLWAGALPFVFLGLWSLSRLMGGFRWQYFRRPTEIFTHLSAVLALALPLFFSITTNLKVEVLSNAALTTELAFTLLLLSLLYGCLAWIYRSRRATDLAVILAVGALYLGSPTDYKLKLALLGFGLTLVSGGLLEIAALRNGSGKNFSKILGRPLQQWGYGLATFGTLAIFCSPATTFNGRGEFNQALLAGSLYFLLALVSSVQALTGRLEWWVNQVKRTGSALESREIRLAASSIWLYPVFGLPPFCLWQIWPSHPTISYGFGLAGLALLYFGLALLGRRLLTRYNGAETGESAEWGQVEKLKELPVIALKVKQEPTLIYATPAFLGWAATGLGAILLLGANHFGSLLVGFALTATLAVATVVLQWWKLNYLVALLGLWAAFNAVLVMGMPVESWPLFGVGAAVVLAVLGYRLGLDYGRPFRQFAHLLAGICGIVVPSDATFYRLPYASLSSHPGIFQIVATILTMVLYLLIAWRERKLLFYYLAGLVITCGNVILVERLSLTLGWPDNLVLGITFLAWATIAGICHLINSRKMFTAGKANSQKGLRAASGAFQWAGFEDGLSTLSHFWAGLALVAVAHQPDWFGLVGTGVLLLYIFRSVLLQKAHLLIVPVCLAEVIVLSTLPRIGWPLAASGLALVGLGTIYLALAWFFQTIVMQGSGDGQKVGIYFQATNIFKYGGRLTLLIAIGLAAGSEMYLMLTLAAIALVGLWQALQDRPEWCYVVEACGLVAYVLGFSLLNWDNQWLGLALFIPAGCISGGGLLLQKTGLSRHIKVGRNLVWHGSGLIIIGLVFSWLSPLTLLMHGLLLTLVCLVMLGRTRRFGWVYPLLAAFHLVYLTGVTLVFGSEQVWLGAALVGPALLAAIITIWLGSKSPENKLAQVSARLVKQDKIFNKDLSFNREALTAVLEIKTLPFYLVMAIDLPLSLVLTTNSHLTGLIITVAVSGLLVVMARWEKKEFLAWLVYPTIMVGLWHSQWLTTSLDPSQSVLVLAMCGFGLMVLVYLGDRRFLGILTRPLRCGAFALLATASCLQLSLLVNSPNKANLWGNLSWLLTFVGLTFLLVSLVEQYRRPTPPALLRYLGYASIALLEWAFILWLMLAGAVQLQAYTIPVGLLCLGFGWFERWHINRRGAFLLEAAGLIILLGTTLLQALGWQTAGLDKGWYGTFLLAGSILAVGWGAANRLRYYFFGGIGGVIMALVVLLIDPIRLADRWLTLGGAGLVLITVALVLERKRERIKHTAGEWLHRLGQWQ